MAHPKPERNRESAKQYRDRLKERNECILRVKVPLALKEEARAVLAEWIRKRTEEGDGRTR